MWRFVAQRRVWHLMEQRMRDAGRGKTKESEHMVRLCEAMCEGESRFNWSQVEEAAL